MLSIKICGFILEISSGAHAVQHSRLISCVQFFCSAPTLGVRPVRDMVGVCQCPYASVAVSSPESERPRNNLTVLVSVFPTYVEASTPELFRIRPPFCCRRRRLCRYVSCRCCPRRNRNAFDSRHRADHRCLRPRVRQRGRYC